MFGVALVVVAPLGALASTAQESWLRVDDPVAARAIASGREKSATFRALLERLERADLIVYVDRALTQGDRTRGDTRFVVRAGGFRFLRVTLEVHAVTNSVVALIGHELRHLAEVADAPWIVDEASYGAHFKTVGYSSCVRAHPCYETNDAVLAGDRILREMTTGHRREVSSVY
ncbi:MAG TPA: hypothetical protein VIY56_00525 [Vicinamibacterales bacterium]